MMQQRNNQSFYVQPITYSVIANNRFGLSPPKRKAGKAPFTAGIHLSEAKNFTIEGILPLPRRRHYANARPKDSLVPERFYGDNPGVSPHNFKHVSSVL